MIILEEKKGLTLLYKRSGVDHLIVKDGKTIDPNFMEETPNVNKEVIGKHTASLTFHLRLLPTPTGPHGLVINHTTNIPDLIAQYVDLVNAA